MGSFGIKKELGKVVGGCLLEQGQGSRLERSENLSQLMLDTPSGHFQQQDIFVGALAEMMEHAQMPAADSVGVDNLLETGRRSMLQKTEYLRH